MTVMHDPFGGMIVQSNAAGLNASAKKATWKSESSRTWCVVCRVIGGVWGGLVWFVEAVPRRTKRNALKRCRTTPVAEPCPTHYGPASDPGAVPTLPRAADLREIMAGPGGRGHDCTGVLLCKSWAPRARRPAVQVHCGTRCAVPRA